ncbi:MAG: aminotransferase class V-fold PLP-dependent enzyme, partial [Eubacteriaceae bacterium]|nr:aminotransferase class V-fold PLP-dependent enzyme [Eubacteriaceae bacterium]
GEHIPGNISLSFNNMEGEAILHRLDLMGICVSTGSACDSVNTQVSHVLKAIRTPEGYAKGTVRISLGKNNTPAQAERIADSLIKIVKTPRE